MDDELPAHTNNYELHSIKIAVWLIFWTMLVMGV